MSIYAELKAEAFEANKRLVDEDLVVLTWGNASVMDRARGVLAIKPSGVSYADMKIDDMVVLELDSGIVIEGDKNPSSDTPTHLELYRGFPEINGIVHTHSIHATAWAQAERGIPGYGTTHADHWAGEVPLVRCLTRDEVEEAYERATGEVIVQWFKRKGLDPLHYPGGLVSHHGPFTWGKTVKYAVDNAVALEALARMAMITEELNPSMPPLPDFIAGKHFSRKHGPGAYYGQKEK